MTKKNSSKHETWQAEPEEHDYPAAGAYLALLAPEAEVKKLVKALRKAPIVHQKAKDILRASRLPVLDPGSAHVAAELHKVDAGKALSPVLLVRGDLHTGVALQIADGYHRVCASYHLDENADIPCKLIDLS